MLNGKVVTGWLEADAGMTGSTSADGCAASCRTVWWATCAVVLSPSQETGADGKTARLVDRAAAVVSAVTSAAEICPVALNDDGVRAALPAQCRIYAAAVSGNYPAMIWVAKVSSFRRLV